MLRVGRGLAGPDTSGEGADGGEAEAFVELDGGAIFCGDGEGEFAEAHVAEGFGGRLHQRTAEAVALITGQDADLSCVADTRRDLAGENGGDQVVIAWLAQDERCARNKLAASWQQDNIF